MSLTFLIFVHCDVKIRPVLEMLAVISEIFTILVDLNPKSGTSDRKEKVKNPGEHFFHKFAVF